MLRFASLLPCVRRSARLAFTILLSVSCVSIGCGDFCLFCEGGGSQNACEPDPCVDIANAVSNSCEAIGQDDFTCDCGSTYFWDGTSNTCVNPCAGDPCDTIGNAVAGSCEGKDAGDFTCGCDDGYTWDAATNNCVDNPCLPDDPCNSIDNAVDGSCTPDGQGGFTCDCESGYGWDANSNTCETDPCSLNPCDDIDNAVPSTCTAVGLTDFTCTCNSLYTWDAANNQCVQVDANACNELKGCLKGCSGFEDFTCQNACYVSSPGCSCLGDLTALISACGGQCLLCFFAQDKACYDCVLDCGFAHFCE
jgi:hypothetical protein